MTQPLEIQNVSKYICMKAGRNLLAYQTVQLRSADRYCTHKYAFYLMH